MKIAVFQEKFDMWKGKDTCLFVFSFRSGKKISPNFLLDAHTWVAQLNRPYGSLQTY